MYWTLLRVTSSTETDEQGQTNESNDFSYEKVRSGVSPANNNIAKTELRRPGSGCSKTTPPARSFSNKAFRNEVNFLARSLSKKKVLESYATAIRREQSKLAKKANKRKKSAQNSEGESDDETLSSVRIKITFFNFYFNHNFYISTFFEVFIA